MDIKNHFVGALWLTTTFGFAEEILSADNYYKIIGGGYEFQYLKNHVFFVHTE